MVIFRIESCKLTVINIAQSVGVRGADLVTADGHIQIDLFDPKKDIEPLERAVDILRKR